MYGPKRYNKAKEILRTAGHRHRYRRLPFGCSYWYRIGILSSTKSINLRQLF